MMAWFCKLKAIVSTVIVLLLGNAVRAQICVNKYEALNYAGPSYDSIIGCVATNNEIAYIGRVFDFNNPAHIAKLSSKGTPLWSYQYKIDYFSFYPPTFFRTVKLNTIIGTKDGGYVVSGCFDRVLDFPIQTYSLLAKLDKFGKVVWSKTLNHRVGNMNFSAVYETAEGDIIAYLYVDNGRKTSQYQHSYAHLLRIGANGNTKWSRVLHTGEYDAGGLGLNFKQGITQLKNNNIVLAHAVQKTVLGNGRFKTQEGNLHFLELDYTTGQVKWEKSYLYPVPNNDSAYKPNIFSVSELANGKLSIIATLYLSTTNLPLLLKRTAYIVTNNTGLIEKITAFTPTNNLPSNVVSASGDISGTTQTVLIKQGVKNILFNIDASGGVGWSKSYDDEGGLYPVTSFTTLQKRFAVFMGNYKTIYNRLLITDTAGIINCADDEAGVIAETATDIFDTTNFKTDVTKEDEGYTDQQLPFRAFENYSLNKTIHCQQTVACCKDVVDSATHANISICELNNYTLPDGTVVKDAGSYYITTKTALGCDSITYFTIKKDKDVTKLSLGNDSCLTQPVKIILRATTGFEKYFWNGNSITAADTFAITMPGSYAVKVSNKCGTKTDSIIIHPKCDYPIYMPTAFTPNNDGINDDYGISSLNKNILISFKIYNRWGQVVFQTNKATERWNGRYKTEQLQFGSFTYYIQMLGLSGKRLTAKGSFMLLR
jgi:gliding motility-associated-like protein